MGLFDFVGDVLGLNTEAPDTAPIANASIEAQRLANELGREQLAESKRQYDKNKAVADKVVNAQLGLMDQTRRQGDDFYEYSKSFRPLERSLVNSVIGGTASQDLADRNQITAEARSQAQNLLSRANTYDAKTADDIAFATGSDSEVLRRFGADINNDVARAVADARNGQTQAQNMAMRQALRYGLSVPAQADALSAQNAASLAAAANNARSGSINNYRNLAMQGIGMNQNRFLTSTGAITDAFNRQQQASQSNRNMRIQDTATDFARKLDVAGIARGLPGASQGAYGLSINAGNSANQNQMAPGNNYLNAMQGGIGTIQRGQQIGIGGLGTVAGIQSQTRAQNLDVIGTAIGAGAALSDSRLKTNVQKVGVDRGTGLNLYEFSYIAEPARRFVGVMAQEVAKRFPQAVGRMSDGMMFVNYRMLGLEMKEV